MKKFFAKFSLSLDSEIYEGMTEEDIYEQIFEDLEDIVSISIEEIEEDEEGFY